MHGAGGPLAAAPSAVGLERPAECVVGQAALERVVQLGLELGALDRRQQLDTGVEVAWHQVSRADVVAVIIAAVEGVDARVLEEASDDRDDVDGL